MLRRQSLIALGVAVLLGIVAVYLANTFLDARVRAAKESPEGMTRIAVAAVPLEFGKALTPEQVKWVNYSTETLPPGVFKTMAELAPEGKARVVLRPLQPNQPILLADVSGEGHPSIASLLPDGMRAVTVTVNAVSGVAGFVVPNDTVDVLITRQPPNQDGRTTSITDVLLQNVRVIATDQRQQNPDGQPIVSQTATLEVTPVDAQKLVLGQQLGQLSFALRKPGEDQNIGTVETVSLADLRYSQSSGVAPSGSLVGVARNGGTAAPAPKVKVTRLAPRPKAPASAPAARPVAPATQNVEVTRGTESSTYEVGGYAR